ncbi:MAG: hypothetical protein ACRDJ4_05090 [Actinomycetota bacterium]
MWRRSTGVLAIAAALVAAGCSEPAVRVHYRFPQGQQLTYRWVVEASTTSDAAGGTTTQRLRMTLDAQESVVTPQPGGGATLRLVLTPVRLVRDGRNHDPGPPVEAELDVAPTGRLQKILQAADLPPEAVAALDLDRLLAQTRPLLPPGPVKLGDRWPTPLTSKTGQSSIDLEGEGRLAAFSLREGKRLARVETNRHGNIRSEQNVGPDSVLLDGGSRVSSTAFVDLDRGVLVEEVSRSVSRFDLSVGEAGSAGTIVVHLSTRASLQG